MQTPQNPFKWSIWIDQVTGADDVLPFGAEPKNLCYAHQADVLARDEEAAFDRWEAMEGIAKRWWRIWESDAAGEIQALPESESPKESHFEMQGYVRAESTEHALSDFRMMREVDPSKTFVVEAHRADGDCVDGSMTAIFNLDRAFLAVLNKRRDQFQGHLSGIYRDPGYSKPESLRFTFEAPKRYASFDGDAGPGVWNLTMTPDDFVVSYSSIEQDCVSTGVSLDELIEAFDAQAPGEVSVFARANSMSDLVEEIEVALLLSDAEQATKEIWSGALIAFNEKLASADSVSSPSP